MSTATNTQIEQQQPQIILITGASRGLGLATVRYYAIVPNTIILATARNPVTAHKLQEVAKEYSNVHILPLDVADEESIRALPTHVSKYSSYISVLINNAGIAHDSLTPSKVDLKTLQEVFLTNTFAPLLITQVLIPFLEKMPRSSPPASDSESDSAGTTVALARSTPRVVMMSSFLGSITLSPLVATSGYSASKTALNSLTKLLSIERKDIAFLILSPGWVQTDMGGPNATLTEEEAVPSFCKVIDNFTLDKSGTFLDHQNNPLDW